MRRRAAIAAAALVAVVMPVAHARSAERVPGFAARTDVAIRGERVGNGLIVRRRMRSPVEALRAALSGHDLRALPGALRDYVGTPRPGVASADPYQTLRYGIPAGDLDGDRLADVLDLRVQVLSLQLMSVTARRGTDGRRLWSIDFGQPVDALVQAIGSGEVLLTRFDVTDDQGTGACAIGACGEAGEGRYRWTFSLLSGRSGRAIWSRSFEGRAVLSDASTDAGSSEGAVATNGLVVPLPAGDLDRDGKTDVVFDAFDAAVVTTGGRAGVDPLEASVDQATPVVTTHASVTSGRTGRTLMTRDSGPTPGEGFLLPAGEETGDRVPDLVWQNIERVAAPQACAAVCAGAGRSRFDVELIDGARRSSVWKTTTNDPDLEDAVVVPASADVSGDRRDDLLLGERRSDGRFEAGVVSGADGRVLWTVPADPRAAVDVIGGRAGVLVTTFVVLSRPESPSLRVALSFDRRNGNTGRLTRRTREVFSDTRTRSIALIDSYVLGDGDRDGVADVAVDALYRDFDIHDVASVGFVESGRTGSRLWSRRRNGFAITQPAGDVTADGSSDVLDLVLGEDDLAISAVDFRPVRRVWTRLVPAPDGFLSATSGGADARPGDDQVLSRLRVTKHDFLSRIDGLSSDGGRVTWGVGRVLPAWPRGKIAGRVRDTRGRNFADVCVFAYDGSGRLTGSTTADADGTYQLGRLTDGRYRVQFVDCTSQTDNSRWYKQKTDLRSADVVIVRRGGRTTGVDEVLPR